jgi:Ferritin-like domain
MIESNSVAPRLDAVEIEGITRGSFVLRSALAVGAVYGTAMVGPFVSQALAQTDGDVDILNFALTLEYLEADFYKQAAKLDLESEIMDIVTEFGDHEAQHVDAIMGTVTKLGGKPAAEPTFTFPMKDQASFLKLAQTLEDTGVSAYNGAGPLIQSKDVLAAAGSIVQIEARHAAAIRLKNGETPAPEAFDVTLGMDAVLTAVQPFIKS